MFALRNRAQKTFGLVKKTQENEQLVQLCSSTLGKTLRSETVQSALLKHEIITPSVNSEKTTTTKSRAKLCLNVWKTRTNTPWCATKPPRPSAREVAEAPRLFCVNIYPARIRSVKLRLRSRVGHVERKRGRVRRLGVVYSFSFSFTRFSFSFSSSSNNDNLSSVVDFGAILRLLFLSQYIFVFQFALERNEQTQQIQWIQHRSDNTNRTNTKNLWRTKSSPRGQQNPLRPQLTLQHHRRGHVRHFSGSTARFVKYGSVKLAIPKVPRTSCTRTFTTPKPRWRS